MPAPDRPAYLEAKRKSILTAAGIKCGRIFGTSIWDETLYKATLQPQIDVSILTALSANRPGHMSFMHSYLMQTNSPKASLSCVGHVVPSKRPSLNGQPYCSLRIPMAFVSLSMMNVQTPVHLLPLPPHETRQYEYRPSTAAITAMATAYTLLLPHSRIKQDINRWLDCRVIGSRTYHLLSKYSSSPSQAGAANSGPV